MATNHRPTVLVADDEAYFSTPLVAYLERYGYGVIVARTGEEALKLAETHRPDLALVDMIMPGPSGIELANLLKQYSPGIEAIIITGHGSTETAVEAMAQGAFYYLDKPLEFHHLLDILGQARERQKEKAVSALRSLTPRERQVLALAAQGWSDTQIAKALTISTRTASNHMHHILIKLGVDNRVQAAVIWDRFARDE